MRSMVDTEPVVLTFRGIADARCVGETADFHNVLGETKRAIAPSTWQTLNKDP
jgi:hypothetical protein